MDHLRHPDVIVVGTGRSGTTNTARIIHDHFEVCLGHDFCAPKEAFDWRPGREDHTVIRYTRSLLEEKGHTPEQWLYYWNKAHEDADCKAALRGTKQCHLAPASLETWLTIAPRLVIRTHRPRELVVNSLYKWREKTRQTWEDFYDTREEMMDKALTDSFPSPIVHVYYTKDVMSDAELIAQLTPCIGTLTPR